MYERKFAEILKKLSSAALAQIILVLIAQKKITITDVIEARDGHQRH